MAGFPIKTPTAFELGILKWIVLPLSVLFIIVTLINITERRWECSRICKAKGFYSYFYIQRSRGGPEKCICITEEESKTGNLIPNGVQVF